MAIFLILIPLFFYFPMFLYETYIAFIRIGKPHNEGGAYLHATWEVTHTLLILSINNFVWLYSTAVVAVGREVFVPLLFFGAVFIVRAILYIRLFYFKPTLKSNMILDKLFAWLHIVMLMSLCIVLVKTFTLMINGNYSPNYVVLQLLYPGIFLIFPIICMPLYFLYKTKR